MAENQILVDAAYQGIVELIAAGELSPGAIVSHRRLAERLSMSKQPVGMALALLEYEGVVASRPRVGTVVNRVTADDMWGMLQWRLAIECRAATLACDRIGGAESLRLRELAAALDGAIGTAGAIALEREFHLAVAAASGCGKLYQELRKLNLFYLKSSLCDALRLVRAAGGQIPCPVPHAEVAAAIRPGNGRQAAEILARHLEESPDMRAFTSAYRNLSEE